MPYPAQLQIIPLGGLGEFGMNMMVYRWGRDCVIVDAGMMFPGAEHHGIEVVIPDMRFLDSCGTLHGLVLTHGHEDHIGAVPFLLAARDVPVYAAPYTAALVRHRLAEHGLAAGDRLRPLPSPGARLRLGPFEIEPLAVSHSIPHSCMLAIDTPVGLVVHTADFKLELDAPGGAGTDLRQLATLGERGVLLLLSDSTNADRPGITPGESGVDRAFDQLLAGCRGRFVVTTFASNVRRVGQLCRLAAAHRRKVCLAGRSVQVHTEQAEDLGLLGAPPGSRVTVEQAARTDPQRLVVIAGGSQGEPQSTMMRIAVGQHREIGLESGDLVVHAAREIPGNEKSISRMLNHCLRRGAAVVTSADAPVHVSGHARADELRTLIHLLRPRHVLPIHGEYRQLQAHARLAVECGLDASSVLLADSGDLIEVRERGIATVDRVSVGQVFIDAAFDAVDAEILRDRRRLAGDGLVIPVVALPRGPAAPDGYLEIVTRGFVGGAGAAEDALLQDARRAVERSIEEATPEERADEGLLKARIQTELRRFLRRRTQRRPLVIPVVLEL